MAWKIKKNDEVIVLTGSYKGHKGKVLKVDRDRNRVIVEGANLVTCHKKPSAQFPEGGKIKKESSLHVSNVAIVDEASGFPTRVGFKIAEDGKKVRYSKRSGSVIKEER